MTIDKETMIYDEITDLLISTGMPSHIQGFDYLKEGIFKAVIKPSIINNMTKEFYPAIAQHFHTSVESAERNIRNCITKAYVSGSLFQSPDFKTSNCVDLTQNHCNSYVISVYARAIQKRLTDREERIKAVENGIARVEKIEALERELAKYKRIYGDLKN